MTSEIALMNREAVAIAADSASTYFEERGQKIFTSANKIFTLSKFQPVGIMIYGNSYFMGVPWEIIIKLYRKDLYDKIFNTIKEYANDFLKFIKKKSIIIAYSDQDIFYKRHINIIFNLIRNEIENEFQNQINVKKKFTDEEIKEITIKIIEKFHKIWKKTKLIPSIPKNHKENCKTKYEQFIKDSIKKNFEKLPLTQIASNQLLEIAISFPVKFPQEYSPSDISGIVIVGFGSNEIFPKLQSILIGGMINNQLRYKKDKYINVGSKSGTGAAIIPFAQKEMVINFMEGVDPKYQEIIEYFFTDFFKQYPEVIINSLKNIDNIEKIKLIKNFQKKSNGKLKEIIEKMKIFRMKNYVDPVGKVVALLPKDELAAMAESLVNLTSFKRKVSMQIESVGGPIDVAVISKGDGFIWIKRKHYFKPELNPHFFSNYYREEENGTKK